MKKFIIAIVFISILPFIFIGVYYFSINKTADFEGEKLFIVKKGDSVSQIARNLRDDSLIESEFWFKFYVWRSERQSALQAGEYVFGPGATIKKIVSSLAFGETENQEIKITLLEGWTIDDIDGYLSGKNILPARIFSNAAKTAVKNWNFDFNMPEFMDSMPENASLEGYLFPDTYLIYKDAGEKDIIKKLLDNFGAKLDNSLISDTRSQGKTLHEIITLASILEKEVSSLSDMKLVSGIFWKRLDIGMALQADSTVNYITGKDSPAISLADREIDSLYNTYKYPGLPPGPICNPGLNAIRAAVYPEASPYLFYLNRQDTGETIFSRTHEEHVANKNKYLK